MFIYQGIGDVYLLVESVCVYIVDFDFRFSGQAKGL